MEGPDMRREDLVINVEQWDLAADGCEAERFVKPIGDDEIPSITLEGIVLDLDPVLRDQDKIT